MDMKKGKLLIVGIGPGSEEHMTKRAYDAILESDCILGYTTYIKLISHLITTQEVVEAGMTEEVSRAHEAIRIAETGKKVAVISSGDAGVYGMAGLIYEVLAEKGWKEEDGISVEIIPGISAINSCASLLGAPIMHDACTISLSDHLTPWELIKKRIESAAEADFVIALYNPKSGRRTRQIEEAQRILLQYRSPNTPVGLIKSAYRDNQHIVLTDLANMLDHEIGMLTTVIIGNQSTFVHDEKMITPRGYARKYTLGEEEQTLKLHERLKAENEPWALHGGNEQEISSKQLAEEALAKILHKPITNVNESTFQPFHVFEFAISPGVANKKLTAQQLRVIAEVIGDTGELEYTPDHQFIVSLKTDDPKPIVEKLKELGLQLLPVGDVVVMKACDFCDGDRSDGLPYAQQLFDRIGGMKVPKKITIGFNGCGMACYTAPANDIGIIYRKNAFDLFIGGKTTGKTAHTAQFVEQGIAPERIVDLVVDIVNDYKERGLPNERFHKFFKRVKEIKGYQYVEIADKIEMAIN